MNELSSLAINKILAILKESSIHGYEIAQRMNSRYGNDRFNKTYRRLYSLERLGLLESKIVPQSSGRDLRVYSLSSIGQHVNKIQLRDAIELILSEYDRYLWNQFPDDVLKGKKPASNVKSVLFTAIPAYRRWDAGFVDWCLQHYVNASLDVLDKAVLHHNSNSRINFLNGNLREIPQREESYDRVWILRTPSPLQLNRIITECRRVLAEDGQLKFLTTKISPVNPENLRLESFFLSRVANLYPEMSHPTCHLLESRLRNLFGNCDIEELTPELTIFSSVKE